MKDKILEILEYYRNTYGLSEPISGIMTELLDNNVEVNGNSFYCPIEKDGMIVLLAGTKEKADMWVLKKIISLIHSGKPILTAFNGNSDYLIGKFKRYDMNIINRIDDISIISFNMKGQQWLHSHQ